MRPVRWLARAATVRRAERRKLPERVGEAEGGVGNMERSVERDERRPKAAGERVADGSRCEMAVAAGADNGEVRRSRARMSGGTRWEWVRSWECSVAFCAVRRSEQSVVNCCTRTSPRVQTRVTAFRRERRRDCRWGGSGVGHGVGRRRWRAVMRDLR